VIRISSPLGEVKLNVHKVTNGLAHNAVAKGNARRADHRTVWGDGNANPAAKSSNSTADAVEALKGNRSGGAVPATGATAGSFSGGPGNGNPGNGNGNNGHGNGIGGGATGNGRNGTGNSGNGGNGNSGNSGNGSNGHHYGWSTR
jgi:hypothetical protein